MAASQTALECRIAVINEERAEQARLREREAQRQLEATRIEATDKAGRQDYMRRKLRKPHLDALAALPELVAADRVAALQADLAERARERVEQLRHGLPTALDRACFLPQAGDWIYGVTPPLWRLLVLRQFVLSKKPGYRFNNQDVFRWVKRTFPIDRVSYGLFMAQYSSRRSAREAGCHKRVIDCWALTHEENAMIPNFYSPTNGFTERLSNLAVIRRLPDQLGGYEVAHLPQHGRLPVAAVSD